ncbi:glycine--tRNA ligase [Rubellicoccus peritrichatus]|uniref:Glycine--tRNA ligase n=1 Tax=Rubellicoccus peritrichatus TaxID=3080537 RepID=A0AAQ3L6F5_9BACT|nr:glycine--tRNA ligase [Puniceicoccus sp. CR14]WOO39846.1 glycine--tRNA ligase [Puniceicoccus sp. CR14]
MAKEITETPAMETIVTLCKRRGFVFQSSDIYGGYNGFFDYGPLGVEVKKNIKDAWWRDMVHRRDDVVGLDSSIIMHPNIWKASGHVGGFSDPMVDCKESKLRYRADQLFWAAVVVGDETIGYVSVLEDGEMEAEAQKQADSMKRKLAKQGEMAPLQLLDYTEATPDLYEKIPSPATGKPGSLTAPRDFNLMFETKVGPLADSTAVAYLRPETAQGIFANYKNIVDTGRVKMPFGIAQIGKAFRNEITPRNFIFRSREFEQMEMEFFIEPGEESRLKWYRYWLDWCTDWLVSIGIDRDMISEDVHPEDKLSHYSKGTTDLMFKFPHGVQELWGIACRGCFDLTQHQEHSGKSMEFFDQDRKDRGEEPFKYIPHVVEPALGVDRTFLAVLTAAYTEDEIPNDKGKPEKRSLLKFHPRIAPYKAAVFPLVKNKPELLERARGLFEKLQRRWSVAWDVSGAIGRRYRRQDEIGTPYCITVDFDTIEKDGTVTIRDRDTTEQKRLSEDEVIAFLSEKIDV